MLTLRGDIKLNFEYYNNLKDYFKGDYAGYIYIDRISNVTFFNKHIGEISITGIGYRSVTLKIIIKDENGRIQDTFQKEFNKISLLCSLFKLEGNNCIYLINIDKDVPLTLENCISKINIIKWNCINKEDYIYNLLAYSDFNKEFELLQVTYACIMAMDENIYTEDGCKLAELMAEKYDYYGYNDEYIDSINEKFDNSKDILNNMIYALFRECDTSDYQKYAYDTAMEYLRLKEEETKGSILY